MSYGVMIGNCLIESSKQLHSHYIDVSIETDPGQFSPVISGELSDYFKDEEVNTIKKSDSMYETIVGILVNEYPYLMEAYKPPEGALINNADSPHKICIWPNTGHWCHSKDIQRQLNAGHSNRYKTIQVEQARVVNVETWKAEIEEDQNYYINIEVDLYVDSLNIAAIEQLCDLIDEDAALSYSSPLEDIINAYETAYHHELSDENYFDDLGPNREDLEIVFEHSLSVLKTVKFSTVSEYLDEAADKNSFISREEAIKHLRALGFFGDNIKTDEMCELDDVGGQKVLLFAEYAAPASVYHFVRERNRAYSEQIKSLASSANKGASLNDAVTSLALKANSLKLN